jgi:HEAT repeat protein
MTLPDWAGPFSGVLRPHEAVDWIALFVLLGFFLVLAMSLALLVHHWVSAARKLRRARALADAGALITRALPDGMDSLREAAGTANASIGASATGQVLRELRLLVVGPTRESLTALLEASGELARMERAAHSWRAWRRVQAAKDLGDSGGRRALVALRGLVQDRDAALRAAAREALAGHEDGAADALASFIADPERPRAHHSSVIAKISRVSASVLREELAAGRADAHLLLVGLAALGDVRDGRSADLARASAHSPDPDLRALSLRMLGQLRAEGAEQALLDGLKDGTWFVRAAAARALGAFPATERLIEALGSALYDPAWWVRQNAASALARHPAAHARLHQAAAGTTDPYARDAAETALLNASLQEVLAS